MNKFILIIGAGQIGSRHLQGLLKLKNKNTIYVIDPFPDALKLAKQRADEIDNNHKISFRNNWENLPSNFDLVIIATNSSIRGEIVLNLLNNYTVKYLILEKVLFQDLETYRIVGDLIDKKKVKSWVNHPRRMYGSYKTLKQRLNSDHPKIYQIIGGNWRLGCNGLHFVDLILYLSGSKISYLDIDLIDNIISESKRPGYIEFTGTIKGCLEDGSFFIITSLKGQSSTITILVSDSNDRYIIQESGTPMIYCMSKSNNFKIEESSFKIEFQSTLTTNLADQLFNFDTCDLPTYTDARRAHEHFIASLLYKYVSITKIETKYLPI